VNYEERITSVVVVPQGKPLFDEFATTISIQNEVDGEFVAITQNAEESDGEIRFDVDEWPAVRAAINRMVRRIRIQKS